MLAQNRSYTVADVCERLNISRRTFYYYIEYFQQAGFTVEKVKTAYSLSRNSKFFRKLYDILQFTNEEAQLIKQLIDSSSLNSIRVKALRAKLDNFYDYKILEDENLHRRTMAIQKTLVEAVRQQRRVCIKGYSSVHSRTVTDRVVEPFLFLNNNRDVRCYELSSGKNKTFRLSRMDDVEVLEERWQHEDRHKQAYTDLFSFSDEQTHRVTLIMGQLAHSLMLEEYEASAPCFAPREDGRWLFVADVCSYLGIGRFVMGLYDDIEIVGDEGFREYVTGKLQEWTQNLKK